MKRPSSRALSDRSGILSWGLVVAWAAAPGLKQEERGVEEMAVVQLSDGPAKGASSGLHGREALQDHGRTHWQGEIIPARARFLVQLVSWSGRTLDADTRESISSACNRKCGYDIVTINIEQYP
jgi:hypothetical protein